MERDTEKKERVRVEVRVTHRNIDSEGVDR